MAITPHDDMIDIHVGCGVCRGRGKTTARRNWAWFRALKRGVVDSLRQRIEIELGGEPLVVDMTALRELEAEPPR